MKNITQFSNDNYINKVSGLYSLIENRINNTYEKIKFVSFSYLGLLSLLSMLMIAYNRGLNFKLAIFCCVSIGIGVCMVAANEFFYRKNKQLNRIKEEFFMKLSNDHSVIKDLSLLCVDIKTQESFDKLVEMVIKKENKKAYEVFTQLLTDYQEIEDKRLFEIQKEEFLNKGVLKSTAKSSVFKKPNERFLEMI